ILSGCGSASLRSQAGRSHVAATPDHPTHASYQRLISTEPVWDKVAPLAELRPEIGRILLHAGPPIRDPGTACTPILNAAAAAAVFEGWAKGTEEAHEALRQGEI